MRNRFNKVSDRRHSDSGSFSLSFRAEWRYSVYQSSEPSFCFIHDNRVARFQPLKKRFYGNTPG